MVASAKIPLYLMSLLQGGNMSAEGEQQGKNTLTDKAIAYGTGAISSYIDRLSGKNVIDWLEKVGIKRIQSTKFVDKMNNYLKTLKPSDIEVWTEVIQQKIENIGRDIMGVNYQKGLEQYFEAGLMGKVLGKVGDKWRAEATVTNVTPPPVAPEPTKTPKYVSKNLEVIKWIRTGVKWYDIVNRAKSRWFDPESDVSTYWDISPEIDENGKVNTDNAQINLSSHIRPLQKQMDDFIDWEWQYTSAEDFKTALLEEIESESGDIVNYDRWKKTIIDAAATASAKFWDENGRIPIVEINKIKKKNWKKGNYFNPDDSLYKAIARWAAKIVEQNTLNVDAKALNNELARLYTTQDYLILLWKGTKTVKGWKLGWYTASLAGRIAWAIIWSVWGPITSAIWSVAWWEISSKIHSSNLKNLIKTGNTKLPQSKLFEDARKAQQNKKANMLLPPPSGKPTSADVVNVQTMTGYAPGALQKDMLARGTMPNDSLIQKSKLPNPKIQEWKLQWKPLEEIKSTPIIPKIAKKQETPKKQALPMSQKSAVKYGKVDDWKVLLDSLMPSDRPMGEKTLSDLKYTENKVRTEKKPATKLEVAIEKAKAISDSGGDGEVGNYHIDDVLNKIKNWRIKVYHWTNMENSSKIWGWADLKDWTYLSLTKWADREAAWVYWAKYYADIADKYWKEGIVREFEIPISKLAIDDVTWEIRFIWNT